jgi:hypothetical protein
LFRSVGRYAGDPAAARFEALTTDRDQLRQLFARHRPAVVVIEACALSLPTPTTRA